MLGVYFGIGDFKVHRIHAEEEARKLSEKNNQEINIYDIYRILNEWFNIDIYEGAKAEIKLEKQLCMPNRFMKKIYDYAYNAGKKIIITSDMYLPVAALKEMLNKCGYEGFDKIFVSNEVFCKKSNGTLQEYINEKTSYKNILHIGDNIQSDIEQSKKNGWGTQRCKNVAPLKFLYNLSEMSYLSRSIYTGLINSFFYNSIESRSLYYEYGFTCGGILVWSICQWLEKLRKTEDIDKFLFLARDCEIISEIYNKYFDTSVGKYIWFSRCASEKLILNEWFEEYIVQAIRVEFVYGNELKTIGELLSFCGLECICSKLQKYEVCCNDLRKDVGYEKFKKILYDNKTLIIEQFSESQKIAERYLRAEISGSKKICVVDSCWRGSSIIFLKQLIEKKYQIPAAVQGVLIISDNTEYSEGFKFADIIKQYSNVNLNDKLLKMSKNVKKRAAFELLFSSEHPSLLQFTSKKDYQISESSFIYAATNPDAYKSKEIQKGISDFCNFYYSIFGDLSYKLHFSSLDAFTPIMNRLNDISFVEELINGSNLNFGFRHGNEKK